MENWWGNPTEIAALLNLTQVSGLGATRIRRLIQIFRTPQNIFNADLIDLQKNEGISAKIAQSIAASRQNDYGMRQMEQTDRRQSDWVSFWDKSFPAALKTIPDPPLFLFFIGDKTILDQFAIAIVGTRMPSSYGRSVTVKIVDELVAKNVVIVSGFARGIDTIAHTQTIKQRGKTAAVLGSGLDVIYPPENQKFVDDICEKGCLISEFAFGTKPDAMNFPRRNRIISGLSAGTLVVEAGIKSGALITAYQALEQNREVFAVPGSIFSQKQLGPHHLIKEGAKVVTSAEDILEEFPTQGELFDQEFSVEVAKLSNPQQAIVAQLRNGAMHIDKLSQELDRSGAQLLGDLLHLELSGIVLQQPGKIFVLKG